MLRNLLFSIVAGLLCGGALACNLIPDDCSAVLCGPCPPPLTVQITAPAAVSESDITVSDPQVSCGSNGTVIDCSVQGNSGPGRYQFDVTVTGYEPLHVDETVAPIVEERGCCSCGYTPVNRTATLEPLSSADGGM